ncbi:extracellular solute-binding protein [Anaerococcus urinomassiliensis]|uniref:extracellular solute-binding protein n=1 Tax=Anaerococcus urinomassiliensis TaxID=1745712 RepID=UPI00093FF9B6|nr:extracellular solute-binding protein [Anaerococcus urinomassiliensis]
MKIKKKLLLALAIPVMITGCGKGSESGNASSEDYQLENVSLPLEEKVSLKGMISSSPLAPEDPNEKLIFKRLEDDTNVHIDWTNYNSDFSEKRNLDIAAGDIPDFIWNAEASDADLMKWAETGVIVPVDELVENYMPNLKAIYEQNPEYKSLMVAPDGKMYSFPWIEELGDDKESIHTVNDIPWINVEWLDNLGLDMPTNPEELKEVLIAFRDEDPNGNGEADEIPFSFIDADGNEDFKHIISAFGGDGDNDNHLVVKNDGTLNFTADDDEYRTALEYMNDLYNENLIDPEAFEHDWNAYIAKGKDHKYGLYFTWDKANVSGMNDSYDVLPVMEGPDGVKRITRTNNMGFVRDRLVITSENKNLELTAKWIDKMYEPIQSIQNNWGTYGDKTQQNIFEMSKNGKGEPMLKHLPLEGTAPGELRQKTEVGGPLAILDEYYGEYTTMPDDAKWRLDIIKEEFAPYVDKDNFFPKVFAPAEDLERLAQIEADLFPFISRSRAEFIQNGITDQDWDAYKEELNRLGLEEWLSTKQEHYDSFKEN